VVHRSGPRVLDLLGRFSRSDVSRAVRLDVALVLAVSGLAISLQVFPATRALREGLQHLLSESRSSLASSIAVRSRSLRPSRPRSFFFVCSVASPHRRWRGTCLPTIRQSGPLDPDGGLAPAVAPDAWDGYEYFPYGGDALWAGPLFRSIVMRRSRWASALVFAAVLLAAYTLIRELGGTSANAWVGSLALGLVPSAFNFLASGYVETRLLPCFSLGLSSSAGFPATTRSGQTAFWRSAPLPSAPETRPPASRHLPSPSPSLRPVFSPEMPSGDPRPWRSPALSWRSPSPCRRIFAPDSRGDRRSIRFH